RARLGLPRRAGRRRLGQDLRLLPQASRLRRNPMCSYIVEKARLFGTAKGPNSQWMKVDTANVYYDHPYEADLDHALCVDFVCEDTGVRERAPREISREWAVKLMEGIRAAWGTGDASHAKAQSCSLIETRETVTSLF